jgi:hypothetical protein
MRRYKASFRGRDAVRWLLAARAAGSEEEAVLLGNDMLRAGLLHHVKYRLLFENKDHLYRCAWLLWALQLLHCVA